MTTELSPLGTRCNLKCIYCYQSGMHETEADYDLDKMISLGIVQGSRLCVFGGEPLLLPLAHLERIFKASYEKYGGASIQTNGLLIFRDHIKLFQKYRIGVGVSIDGSQELNAFRCNEEKTSKIIAHIEELTRSGVSVSLIITIHRMNGSKKYLDRLLNFCSWAESIGVQWINFHFLQVISAEVRNRCALSAEENKVAFLRLAEFSDKTFRLQCQPFVDIKRLLSGDRKNVLCVWNSCDPFKTSAVFGIQADGQVKNCHRVSRIYESIKCSISGHERQDSLRQSPQDKGGCFECRFFPLCGGGCPGEAIDADWRNKTEYCETIKALFRYYEDIMLNQGKIPASIKIPAHSNNKIAATCDLHGDSKHGDTPHGDQHGDHWDNVERRAN